MVAYYKSVGWGMIRLLGDITTPHNILESCFKGEVVVVANLEAPILSQKKRFMPSRKCGPHLSSMMDFAQLPKGMILTLANNHIMDYGEQGMVTTADTLRNQHVHCIGVGKFEELAREPTVIRDGGLQLGFIGCCESQFGVAQHSHAGVAALGPWVYRSISSLKQNVDHVIISVHAGNEMSPWPSPYIQDLYRSYIDAGASVIHGHHPHVPQGYEEYNGGIIFYGMGNFSVDPDQWNAYPNAIWSVGADIDFQYFPSWSLKLFEIKKAGDTNIIVEEIALDDKKKRYLDLCNLPLHDRVLLEGVWQDVSLRLYDEYGAMYMGLYPEETKGRRFALKKGLRLVRTALSGRKMEKTRQSDYLLWYHMFACESHRQMMQTALGLLGGELIDMRTEQSKRLVDEIFAS